ncbi:hypothetical protein D3C76_943220 [compost metagenome]
MLGLVVDAGAAVMLGQVDASTETVIFTKTLAQVEVAANVVASGVVEGDMPSGGVFGALGHQVDGTTNATALWRDPIEEGARPLEYLHPFQRLGGHYLARQHPVQAVVADVVGVQRQTANGEYLRKVAKARRLAH